MPSRLRSPVPLCALSALMLLAAPTPAEACGGTFCDNLPDPMPVDQSGEDILFVLDGSTVEVHIRVEYEGEAERFAWLVPLQGVPEVSVGSEPLFNRLSDATAPAWKTQREYECTEGDPDADGCPPISGCLDLEDGGGEPPPEVLFEEVVGAFEVVVLQGGTAAEVLNFLDANDYAQDPAAEPILQSYLDDDFLFAAVKLTAGASVDAIHPLVFRFPGTEPCVPIRLTRIAAEDDMGIRAYFLGQDRWAPSNYEHVVLNPLAFDWGRTGSQPTRYLELLSLAIDEAGGQAFVTEYAGDSSAVSSAGVYSELWDESAFVGVDPITAIQIIDQQGLAQHPQIPTLLLEFIPPPDGLDPLYYWNNIGEFADLIDLDAWDADAFAAALVERVIDPGLHAVDLLEAWPALTRLHATMSPAEMTEDPTFHPNEDLPGVPASQVTTVEQVLCGGDQVFHVHVDGEDTPVCAPTDTEYPDWSDMPKALRIERIPLMGPPQVLDDNSEHIAAVYQAHEAGVACESEDYGDGDGDGDGSDDDTDEPGLPGDGVTVSAVSRGCACSARGDADNGGFALGLSMLALLGLARRRA